MQFINITYLVAWGLKKKLHFSILFLENYIKVSHDAPKNLDKKIFKSCTKVRLSLKS